MNQELDTNNKEETLKSLALPTNIEPKQLESIRNELSALHAKMDLLLRRTDLLLERSQK